MSPAAGRAIAVMAILLALALALLLRALFAGPPGAEPPAAGSAAIRRHPGPRPTARAADPNPPANAQQRQRTGPGPEVISGAAPTTPDAGPRWQDTLDGDGKYAFDLGNADLADLRAGVDSIARRYPSVKVVSVACVDRPCQAEVDGTDAGQMEAFARDLHTVYQGHVGGRFTRTTAGTGGAPGFRGTFVIGTYRTDKLDLAGLVPPSPNPTQPAPAPQTTPAGTGVEGPLPVGPGATP